MPTPKPPHSAAFGQQMVELVRAGRGVAGLTREFGCNASSSHHWINAERGGKARCVREIRVSPTSGRWPSCVASKPTRSRGDAECCAGTRDAAPGRCRSEQWRRPASSVRIERGPALRRYSTRRRVAARPQRCRFRSSLACEAAGKTKEFSSAGLTRSIARQAASQYVGWRTDACPQTEYTHRIAFKPSGYTSNRCIPRSGNTTAGCGIYTPKLLNRPSSRRLPPLHPQSP